MKNWMTFVLLGLLMLVAGVAPAQTPAAGSVAVTVKNAGAGSTIYWIGPGSPPVLQGIAAGGSPAMFSLGTGFSIVEGALTYSGGVSDGDKGDITVSGSGTVWTIDNGVVGNAKLTNSSITIAGTSTALGGSITAGTILDSLGSTRGSVLYRGAAGWTVLTPGTSGQVLTTGGAGADPTWSTAAGGVSDGDKGDITVSGSGATWTIDDGVVTFAKMQDISTAKLLGRATAGTGDVEEIGLGSGLGFSAGNLGLTNTGVTAASYTAANITVDAQGRVTAASNGSVIGGSTGSTDNAILRADGTGGSTAQASLVTIDDDGNIITYGSIVAGYAITTPTSVNALSLNLIGVDYGVSIWSSDTAEESWTLKLPPTKGTNGQVLTTNGAGVTSWTTVGGTGTVTSVAISGTDGIEVDSGSPITTSGTIQLGVNAATLKTTLDLAGSNSGDVTLAGTPDYITISGQTITRGLVDLGTDVTGALPLANGGTGASLTDPGADRILFWDDSAGAVTWLTAGTGLTITDTTITASGSSAPTFDRETLGSDYTVTASTALESVTGMSIAMDANSEYWIELRAEVTTTGSGEGFRYALQLPTGATMHVVGVSPAAATTVNRDILTTSDTAVVQTGAVGASPRVWTLAGRITTAGTAGNVVLRFACETSGTVTATVEAGAEMELTKRTLNP